jgi:hypothetical protein
MNLIKEPFFQDKTCVLITMHGKEKAILPVFQGFEGLNFVDAPTLNTDILGTFSGEINRAQNPLETALLKAKLGINHVDADYAIANEGSFGPHPSIYFIPADHEWIVILELKTGRYWHTQHISTNTNFSNIVPKNWIEVIEFLRSIDFPNHGIIIKLENEINDNNNQIFKDLDSKLEIEEIFKKYEQIEGVRLSIETDMRAHRNPTRMQVIAETTEKLKRKLQVKCPICNYPGFDVVQIEKGLPCSLCESPTRMIHKALYACSNCNFQEWSGNPDGLLLSDPGFCDYCNP